MCMCMCIFVYVHMCVCVHICVYACMYMCLYVHAYVYVAMCVYVTVCVHVCMCMCIYVYVWLTNSQWSRHQAFSPWWLLSPEKGLWSHPSQESCSSAVGIGGWGEARSGRPCKAVSGSVRESGPAKQTSLRVSSTMVLEWCFQKWMNHMNVTGVPRREWKDTR